MADSPIPTARSFTRRLVRWTALMAIALGVALTVDLLRQTFTSDRVDWHPAAAFGDIEPAVTRTSADGSTSGQGPAPDAPDTRPRLISFTAAYCGSCRWMTQEVFARSAVADRIHATTRPYRVDLATDGEAARRLVGQYKVWATPTLLLVDDQGRELSRLEQAVDADAFLRWLEAGVAKAPVSPLTPAGSAASPSPHLPVGGVG